MSINKETINTKVANMNDCELCNRLLEINHTLTFAAKVKKETGENQLPITVYDSLNYERAVIRSRLDTVFGSSAYTEFHFDEHGNRY